MYRLKVKCGRKWRLGLNVYSTLEEAEARKSQMESVGHIVKIEKTGW